MTPADAFLKPWLSDLISRHDVKVRFVLVGIWTTAFGYTVFCVLDTLFNRLLAPGFVAYMSAMVLSQALATVNAYIFHKYITFKSRVRGWGIVTEFFRFSTTYGVTFGLSLLLLPFFVEVLDIQAKVSAAIIILVCAIISYLGHSMFSFAGGSPGSPAEAKAQSHGNSNTILLRVPAPSLPQGSWTSRGEEKTIKQESQAQERPDRLICDVQTQRGLFAGADCPEDWHRPPSDSR